MIERLYYHDCYLREFDARVLSCEKSQGADDACPSWWIRLEQSAFYPTSGGQPYDTGRLGDAAVLNVFEHEDGTVIHVTDRPLEPGMVRASIDWQRRFDHMQQHTGSHLLCAAFQKLFGAAAVSFHMGKAISTVDVAMSDLSADQLEQVERFVNQAISEDHSVRFRYGSAAELAAMGVAKESEREGQLRAVEIQEVDIQACGGTHVRSTGQIGMILVRRLKRVRDNWRVEFVCGERARRVARTDFTLLEDIAQRLTCGPETIHAGITRILNERNAAARTGRRYLEECAALQAQALLARDRARHLGRSPRTVTHVMPDADMDYLRSVATYIVAEPDTIALLGSESNGFIVIAKSEGVFGDMSALLRDAVRARGGKGGGATDFAQGNVPQGNDLAAILRSAAERAAKPASSLHIVSGSPSGPRPYAEIRRFKGKARG